MSRAKDIAIAALEIAGCDLTPQNISVVTHVVDQTQAGCADALDNVVAAINIRFANYGGLRHKDG